MIPSLYKKKFFNKSLNDSLISLVSYGLVAGLFLQILIFPGILKTLKIPFIGLILVCAVLVYAVEKRIFIHKYVIVIFGLYLARSIIGIIVGYGNDTPGLFVLLPLNLYYVILYIVILTMIKTEGIFIKLIEVLFIGTVGIVLLDLYYIIASLGYLPMIGFYSVFDNSNYPFNFGINQYGTLEMYARNLGFLPICFPFFLGLLFKLPKGANKLIINKFNISITIILMVVLMFMTGRRIFLLIILVSPIFIFIFSRFLKGSLLKMSNRVFVFISGAGILFSFVFFTYLASTVGMDFNRLKDSFFAAFDSSQEGIRFHQSEALLDNWKKAPFLGHGAGAGVPGYRKPGKDRAVPWGFELSYHSRLNQYGLVGFGLEALYYLSIFLLGFWVIRKYNDFLMVALLSGYAAFLLANATNPFLTSFEFLWPIILPLIYINIKLLKGSESNNTNLAYS